MVGQAQDLETPKHEYIVWSEKLNTIFARCDTSPERLYQRMGWRDGSHVRIMRRPGGTLMHHHTADGRCIFVARHPTDPMGRRLMGEYNALLERHEPTVFR